MERFKNNCVRATEGFNHVLHHFQQQQQYLKEVRSRKWQEMKTKGENIRDSAKMAAEKVSSHSKVHAASSTGEQNQ